MTLPSQKEGVVEFPGQGSRPAPLTQADCDLQDFPFMPMDIVRLFGSQFHAVATDAEWRAGVTLWLKSFHQVPAASLPDDDVALARLAELGRDVKAWVKVKAVALRGWTKCSDGRLYHPTVAEKANEALSRKRIYRERSRKANERRWKRVDRADEPEVVGGVGEGIESDASGNDQGLLQSSNKESLSAPRPSQGTGTGTVEDKSSEPSGSAPDRGVEDYDARAWSASVALLTMDEAMSEKTARTFFGKLLSTYRIRARDLLPALVGASINGTKDPKSYLTRAAQRVGGRSATGKQQDVDWC